MKIKKFESGRSLKVEEVWKSKNLENRRIENLRIVKEEQEHENKDVEARTAWAHAWKCLFGLFRKTRFKK